MAFKKPPAILERVMRLGALKHKDGKMLMWGIYGTLLPLSSQVYLQRIIEDKYGIKESNKIFYALGKFQGIQSSRMLSKRFGYAKSISNKAELLKFITSQSELIGHGVFKWAKIDFKNECFVVFGKSTIAEEYKKIFGIQQFPVDAFLRGIATSFVEEILNKKSFCIETLCITMGKKNCEFIVKPLNKWNKKDERFKEQYFKELKTPEQLGAKIRTFIQEY